MIGFVGTKRLLAVLVAALFATAWCAFISPIGDFPHNFAFELSSPRDVTTQIYFQRGAGVRETESSKLFVRGSDAFTSVCLRLPIGKYRMLRLDPIDGAGLARLKNLRIETLDGRVVQRFQARDFSPLQQVERFIESQGVIHFESTPDADDPQLAIKFDPILRLGFGFRGAVELHWAAWITVFALICALLQWHRRLLHGAACLIRLLWQLGVRRPGLALTICAGLATFASSYPVMFLGRSFVSPANGALLLYERSPTIPAKYDVTPEDTRGADVGAMMWQHLPYTVRQHRALKAGELPLWNRYSSSGTTLIGQGQSMFGDPFHLMVIAAGGAPWAFDFKFLLAKTLFTLGVGWCVWLLHRDFAASAISIFASAFIAFFNYRVNHPAIFSLCYSPWILAGWLHVIAAIDRRQLALALALWFAANWTVITSGTVKEAYVLGLMLNMTGALAFFLSPSHGPGKAFRTLVVSGAAVTFILASSPLWWNFLHSLSTAYTSYTPPRAVQIRPEWLVGLFDDMFYRRFFSGYNVVLPSTNFLVLLGCFFACVQPKRLWNDRRAFALVVISAAALGLAFHWRVSPAAPEWILRVPFLRNIHHLGNIFSCVAIVHLCVLGGWGFSAARKPLLEGRCARFALFLACVFIALFVPHFTVEPPGWTDGPEWRGWSELTFTQAIIYLHVGLLPMTVIILMWVAARRLQQKSLHLGLIVAAAVALFVVLARHGQHGRPLDLPPFFAHPGDRGDYLATSPSVEYLQDAMQREPGRVIGTSNNFFPGFATIYDLEGINGPNALENPWYRDLAEAAVLSPNHSWRYEMPAADLPRWRPVLDFLNVRYLAAPPNTYSTAAGYERVAQLDFDIFRSVGCWPRAFFVNRAEAYTTPDELIGRVRAAPAGRPFAAFQSGDIPAEIEPFLRPMTDSGDFVPAGNYELGTNHTAFTINSPGPGIAVLHETWLPEDFLVTVNGVAAKCLRVNHTFKAVILPAAEKYEVVFTYQPKWLPLTLWLASAGVISFGLMLYALARRAPRA